jgi:hypothetical protein
MNLRLVLLGAAAAALSVAASQASAATITDAGGNYTVGIGANGELFDGGPYIGFRRNTDGYDPIAPGTPRDSWGLGSNHADGHYFGSNVGTSLVAGANTATATTTTADGFKVVQNYSFTGAGNVLKIATTVTNLSGAAATGVLFQRDVDWDISPTEFNENVFGPIGASAMVVDSSWYGFENPDPSAGPFALSCFGGCNATSDLGGGIRISLGDLANGGSASFNYYYGVNAYGENVRGLIGDTQAAGAQYIIAGQSSENGSFPDHLGFDSATIGVGPAGVPEPATWATMILGFFGAGAMLRRRSAAIA